MVRGASPGKSAVEAFVCPFWFVRPSAVEAEVNMSLFYKTVTVNDVKMKIPCMRNTRKVESGSELCIAKPTGDGDVKNKAAQASLAKSAFTQALARDVAEAEAAAEAR